MGLMLPCEGTVGRIVAVYLAVGCHGEDIDYARAHQELVEIKATIKKFLTCDSGANLHKVFLTTRQSWTVLSLSGRRARSRRSNGVSTPMCTRSTTTW